MPLSELPSFKKSIYTNSLVIGIGKKGMEKMKNEPVRSIVASIDGDIAAARKVELDLPKPGVCSSGIKGSTCCDVDAT